MTSLPAELLALMRSFVDGTDRSLANANAIEVALDSDGWCDEIVEDTIGMLASYRPGGGPHLYDEQQISDRLKRIIDQQHDS